MFSDNNSTFSMPGSQHNFFMAPTSDDPNSSTINSFFIPRLLRSSSIDSILNRPDAQLDDLLDEEDFSYELKNGNPKLLDYFSKNPESIQRLVDFIIIMPPDPTDPKRSHKFPFVACETFEADSAPIMNAFFLSHALKVAESVLNDSGIKKKDNSEDYEVILSNDTKPVNENKSVKEEIKTPKGHKSLLEHLFSFVETDQELNPVLAGYFNKVVQLMEFVYESENMILKLTKHIKDKSIAELVSLFLNNENSQFQIDEKPGSRLEAKIQAIDLIINALLKTGNEQLGDEESINAGSILNEIIQKHGTIVDGKDLISHVSSSQVVQRLMDSLKVAQTSKISSICNVLASLLQYYTPDTTNLGPLEPTGPGASDVSQEKEKVIQVIVNNMETFQRILDRGTNVNSENMIDTVFGNKVQLIGSWRLKVMEIIHKLILLEDQDINEKINDLNILKIISDLFNESPWNNLLHTIYERLVNTIFDKSDPTLIKALFEKANLLDIIIQAGQEPDIELPKRGRKVRKGYMGHIIRIANELVRFGNIEDNIERQLKANPQWSQFVNSSLKKQNETNNTEIGGYNPRNFVSHSMESSFGSLALAESQTMQTPSSETFAAMPAEIEIVENESKSSPSKAGDIVESHAFQEWKEQKKNQLLESLVETIAPFTHEPLEFNKVPEAIQKPLLEAAVIREGENGVYEKPHDGEVETKHIETKPLENLSPTKEKGIDETLNVPQVSNEEKSLSPEKPRETTTENIEEYKKEPEIHVQKDLKQEAPKENPVEKGSDENSSPNNSEDLKKSAEIQDSRVSIPQGLRERNPAMDQMRKSMLGPKGAKVKLKVKKGEKANPLKIFEAIDRYKSQRDSSLSSSGIEYTFSETESRPSESEGMSVLEEEHKEEMLAKLKEEENKEAQDLQKTQSDQVDTIN